MQKHYYQNKSTLDTKEVEINELYLTVHLSIFGRSADRYYPVRIYLFFFDSVTVSSLSSTKST
jgi:hypothetical protein